jgi:hypothetical protein
MKIKLHHRIVVSTTPPHVHKSYLAQESGTSKKLKYISSVLTSQRAFTTTHKSASDLGV